ncbi:MAG: hypothetical protein IH881_06685 [Myxococcales bacterium]|nr:hypothetical protein [Myxococcales bacterium]
MSFSEEWAEDEAGGGAIVAQIKAITLDPLGLIRRRWIWMVISFVIGILATASFYFTLKPMYLAKATVLVSNQQIPEEFVRSTVSGLDSLSNINAMAGEILSHKNLGKLIEKYDLYSDERAETELADIIASMRKNISIAPDDTVRGNRRRGQENASIFSIEYSSADPEVAAVIANQLAAGFIDSSIRRRNQQARTTTEFMERELTRAEGKLREIKTTITKFYLTHRGSMPMDQETVLRKLERLETHRQNLSDQILSEEERLAAPRTAGGGGTAEARLADLKLSLISQRSLHTDEHPNVIALQQQIEQLEDQREEVNQVYEESKLAHDARLAVVERGLENLRLEFSEIDGEMAALDRRATQIPENAEAFEALTQNSRVLEENYLEFLRKVQDAKLAEELERSQQGPRVSVLDPASTPTEPIRSSARYLQLGIVGSFLLALLIALLAELVDPTVLNPEHFEHIGDPPMLGSIYTR